MAAQMRLAARFVEVPSRKPHGIFMRPGIT
jgi:hypothetical protein